MIKSVIVSLYKKIKEFADAREVLSYLIYVVMFPTLFFLVYVIVNYEIFNQYHNELGDVATYAIQILKAKKFQLVLGPQTRLPFSHPGPISMYYQALMESFLWFKQAYGKHLFAQLFYNYLLILCALHVIYTAFKEKKYYTLLLLVAILFSIWPLGAKSYLELWPPYYVVMAMLVFILSSSKLAYGDFKFFLPLIVSGSFATQNHLGTATLVVPLSILSLVLYIRNIKLFSIKFTKSDMIYGIIACLFFILVFFPVLYEQFTAETGNITNIVKFLKTKGGLQQHPLDVIDCLSAYYYNSFNNIFPVNPYVIVAFLYGIALLSLSKDRTYQNYLIGFMMAGLLLSFYGGLSVKGKLFDHVLLQHYALVALFYFMLLIFVFRFIPLENIKPRNYVIFLFIFSFIFFAKFYKLKKLDPNDEIDKFVNIINPKKNITYELKCDIYSDLYRSQWFYATGIAYKLVKGGYDVCVPDEWIWMYGPDFTCKNKKNISPVYFFKPEKKTDRVVKDGKSYIYKNTRIRIGN